MKEILGKVASNVNKGIATAGVSSKALMEKTKINSKIKSLEAERSEFADSLGMQMYENIIRDKEIVVDENIRILISEIQRCLEQVAEYKAELERVEEEADLAKSKISQKD